MDANSTDDTVRAARAARTSRSSSARQGQGDALITGFKACTGDIIVMVDADGSADGQEIVSYSPAPLVLGADFAKALRG